MQEILNFLSDLARCFMLLIGIAFLLLILCVFVCGFFQAIKEGKNNKIVRHKDGYRPIPPDGGSADD